jgi:hypothetical protein
MQKEGEVHEIPVRPTALPGSTVTGSLQDGTVVVVVVGAAIVVVVGGDGGAAALQACWMNCICVGPLGVFENPAGHREANSAATCSSHVDSSTGREIPWLTSPSVARTSEMHASVTVEEDGGRSTAPKVDRQRFAK